MQVACIGDNCIDEYERIGKRYPTGNVVDTGVNLQKLGIPASVISTTGNDENGTWMIKSLEAEGLGYQPSENRRRPDGNHLYGYGW